MDATELGVNKSWSTPRQPLTLRVLLIEKEIAELVDQKRRAEIGQRIKERREELLLTQEHVAREVNTSTRQYQRWEGGQGTERENYEAIAGALGVSVEWLLHGKNVPSVPSEDLISEFRDRHIRVEQKLDKLLTHFDLAGLEELADVPAQAPARQSPRKARKRV